MRKALSIRFHFSAEARDKGMKFMSNCLCLPTLPTIFDTSTVLLPRYLAPLGGTPSRNSSGESRVLLVARLSKSLFNLHSRARLRATTKSRSTWSSRFLRSTIITYFLAAPGVKLLCQRPDVAERRGPSCGCRRPPSCTTCLSGSWTGRKRPIGKHRWYRPSICPMSPRLWPAPPQPGCDQELRTHQTIRAQVLPRRRHRIGL